MAGESHSACCGNHRAEMRLNVSPNSSSYHHLIDPRNPETSEVCSLDNRILDSFPVGHSLCMTSPHFAPEPTVFRAEGDQEASRH